MKHYDVIVIGGGAAGLMAAFTAGQRGLRTLVLEHMSQVGSKILISGGGRCNFTNIWAEPKAFLSENPHFVKSALSRYKPADFISLVERHRIPYHEKKLGQLFCDHSAKDIVRMLLAECDAGGVEIQTGVSIQNVSKADQFRITTSAGELAARNIILATGGLSIPKMGATGFTHEMARRFDLSIVEPRPGLVPLTASEQDLAWIKTLSGVSIDCEIRHKSGKFRENLLFTHRGLSGPAILQISSYWREGESLVIDLLPDHDAEVFIARKEARPRAEFKTILGELLPQRFADYWAGSVQGNAAISGIMQAQSNKTLREAATRLKHWAFTPSGSEGFAKAEVTLGGVDTNMLSSKTMEVKSVPGLYIIGEAVDVTGWLGGYNFQWAWASGWCAGQSVT